LPRKHEKLPYTKGDANKLIDLLLHPWFQEHPWLIMVDGLLHGLVEYPNTNESIKKFLRYSAPKLIKELERQVERER